MCALRAAGVPEADAKRAKRESGSSEEVAGSSAPDQAMAAVPSQDGGSAAASWTVSPRELREALSGLNRAAVSFELSEMHDASEVCFCGFCGHAYATAMLPS